MIRRAERVVLAFTAPRRHSIRREMSTLTPALGCWVAVGTTIADRPPRGSARALVSARGSYRG